jgi:glycosyltransferase involved in cell wall biosynthesis
LKDYHLHIVCLDVPYPVDYGGVFDLFYKIKSLNEAGIKIHLHCFEYGRGQQEALNQYCEEVHYYSRLMGLTGFSNSLPYIVKSRSNETLLANLQKDNFPVLMEGIHCTYFLHTGQLPKERCFVRLHNVEYEYYHQLWETSTSGLKRIYFKRESKLLKQYEASLAGKATFWTVTEKDLEVFNKELGYESVDYLPLFLPDYFPEWSGEHGNFCLYHGNLSVPENEFAAIWLLQEIFSELEIPFVLAGKQPSNNLEKLAHQHPHTCIVANPDQREMEELIKKAQVNILPSFNSTGIKLKLINALNYGRHCLVNEAGVEGSGLNSTCEIANSKAEMKAAIQRLYNQPFNYFKYEERQELLKATFNNQRNARQMISWIFENEPTIPGVVAERMQRDIL